MGIVVIIIIGIGLLAGVGWVMDTGTVSNINLTGNSLTCFIGIIVIAGIVFLLIKSVHPSEIDSTGNTSDSHPIPNQGNRYEILEQGKDNKGRPFYIIKASNYRDAGELTDGWSYPGNVSWTYTKIGKNKWNVHLEDWDTTFQ